MSNTWKRARRWTVLALAILTVTPLLTACSSGPPKPTADEQKARQERKNSDK